MEHRNETYSDIINMYEKAKTQLSAKIETKFSLSGEAVDAISKL